ncbi:MotA/TolQ/ExbB proton channel family protein, partial [Burkholderia sp. SIMBA_024]|uniref:MotA/TolQ/ExbB proton channel family protein n=1 Tax=Burkholderia sp. SIMBA_024 TaxID=3085768 RepID=UPI00397AD6E2
GMQRGRGTRVFAITGSNGKTSVKSLLLAILQHVQDMDGLRVYATPGNRNNEIGLPLAVIAPVLEQKHRAGDREAIGDLVDAQYLLSKPLMARGLWLLETIVTAAPLLGLLGTVMG